MVRVLSYSYVHTCKGTNITNVVTAGVVGHRYIRWREAVSKGNLQPE